MKKNETLCKLGVEELECQGGSTSLKPETGTSVKPSNIKEAFDQVVQVLHAPYDKGDLFFRIFTGEAETHDSNSGDKSAQIGEGTETGNGTWTVKAGQNDEIAKGNDTRIVYEYSHYQPKGSPIYVTGKMAAMYRSTSANFDGSASIGFNLSGSIAIADAINLAIDTAGIGSGVAAVNAADKAALYRIIGSGIGILVETLEIDGAYQATLKFTYTGTGVHTHVTESNYNEKLFGNRGMFTNFKSKFPLTYTDRSIRLIGSRVEFTYAGETITLAGSKVEFTYADETITLDADQLKKLLRV